MANERLARGRDRRRGRSTPSGAPTLPAARTSAACTATDSAGCELCALATTGQPAAIAAAVSPPATENANGKLDAPNIAIGPTGTSSRRTSASGPIGESWAGSMMISRCAPSRITPAKNRSW